jgi:hypothetical protein
MVVALPQWHLAPSVARGLRLIPVIFALAVLAAMSAFLAWSYVAQPKHPNGVCYESRGRPIPCFVLEQQRVTPR